MSNTRCPACGGEWEITLSENSADATLEALLDDLAQIGIELGRCYVSAASSFVGNDLSREQQWHVDKSDEIKQIKEAIHNHISMNYEED